MVRSIIDTGFIVLVVLFISTVLNPIRDTKDTDMYLDTDPRYKLALEEIFRRERKDI